MATQDELIKKAEAGDVEAQYTLFDAWAFGDKGQKKDPEKAIYWLTKAAQGGHKIAMFTLGVMEISGEMTEKDPVSGAQWLEKCAALGDQYAATTLGMHYLDEKTQDLKKAIKYLVMASEAGRADATYVLGTCYLDGLGVEEDFDKARELLEKAADAGSEEAQEVLDAMDGNE